jgi:transcriptional regulator with XRE-family HTH domain
MAGSRGIGPEGSCKVYQASCITNSEQSWRGGAGRVEMAELMRTARESAEGANSAFGAYLRAQRQAARLTLRELADLANISNPYLSQLERGIHQPSVAVIRSLAEALDLSAELLLAEAAGLKRAVGEETEVRRSRSAGVESAIQADDLLTASQKRALRSVYRSMIEAKES